MLLAATTPSHTVQSEGLATAMDAVREPSEQQAVGGVKRRPSAQLEVDVGRRRSRFGPEKAVTVAEPSVPAKSPSRWGLVDPRLPLSSPAGPVSAAVTAREGERGPDLTVPADAGWLGAVAAETKTV